jgi:hypothetical protein
MLPNLEKPSISFNLKQKIFTKENVLDPDMCDRIIQFGNDNVQKGINKYPHMFGISFHACLLPLNHESHIMLQDAWDEAIKYLDVSADFVEPYELKRYTSNDFFGKHTDNYSCNNSRIDRKITASIQLTDENNFIGSNLLVLGLPSPKTRGSIVAFPSFFPHEVTPIISGTRWSLISWAWGKDFT